MDTYFKKQKPVTPAHIVTFQSWTIIVIIIFQLFPMIWQKLGTKINQHSLIFNKKTSKKENFVFTKTRGYLYLLNVVTYFRFDNVKAEMNSTTCHITILNHVFNNAKIIISARKTRSPDHSASIEFQFHASQFSTKMTNWEFNRRSSPERKLSFVKKNRFEDRSIRSGLSFFPLLRFV